MIRVTGLTKNYGPLRALDQLSLSVERGQVIGILGPNGAGKSTLFKILCGLSRPDAGAVTLASPRAKPIGAIIEGPALFGYLNARDNLRVFAGVRGQRLSKRAAAERLEEVGLSPRRTDRVDHFSMGMKQRLGLAIALLNEPDALVLDEPFSGLDPAGKTALRKLIVRQAREKGLAVLLSSHLMEELRRSCDHLYVIRSGRFVAEGSPEELLATGSRNYQLTGAQLAASEVLRRRKATVRGHTASLRLSEAEVPQLLADLTAEGTRLTAIQPLSDWEQFFDPSGS